MTFNFNHIGDKLCTRSHICFAKVTNHIYVLVCFERFHYIFKVFSTKLK